MFFSLGVSAVHSKPMPYSHKLANEDEQFSLDQVPDLTGKVAVVTGGSEGEHCLTSTQTVEQSLIRCRHWLRLHPYISLS